jgi:hypothetical protein
MAYDQSLTKRIRSTLDGRPGFVEKTMFGGVGFMLHGNMACGVQGNDLIVCIGIENNDQVLSKSFVRPFMVMPGKPMAGWILVAPEGIATDQDLRHWIEVGIEYASTLPEKR